MKKRNIIYHILFWAAIYLFWVLVFRSYSVSLTKTITIEFCYLIFITSDYYAISHFIIPRFLNKTKYGLFILSLVSVIGLSSWLRALVALQMNLHFFKPGTIPGFGTLYLNSFINISIWVLVITTGKMIVDRRQTQQKLEQLEQERMKSELNYLKAQINPHALFNSLNTIYGNIDKSNQVARNILLQFSELLRYQLYDCSAEKVILEKEVEYLTNFVAFHRLRKTEGLVVDLQVENIEPGLHIAPLLLVVLAENAFKYVGDSACKESKIAIRIFTTGTTLHASFFNTNEVQRIPAPANSNGIGIINLKRRLELLYPGKHKFSSHKENDFYETNLTIDLT